MKAQESFIRSLSIFSLTVLLALSLWFVLRGWLGGHFTSPETLRSYVASFGLGAPLVLSLIQMLQVVLPILPGFMGCIAGAALFGAAGGFWINYIGISLGSLTAYWLARVWGLPLVSKMISLERHEPYIRRINRSKSYPILLFLSILLPLAPDDFLCYFSGLIRMPPKQFTAIILLGKPWCILFYCIIFSQLI